MTLRRTLLSLLTGKPTTSAVPLQERQLVIGLGAMKSGTSWLADYLAAHPQFFFSPVKEINAFAQLYPSNTAFPGYVYAPDNSYRLMRMERIILSMGVNPSAAPFSEQSAARFDRLRALAQLGHIRCVEDYISFFQERIGGQMHFGEISPSYSHLPAGAYLRMAGLCSDVRFLFLMRDPTDRAASHLRHLRRRRYKDHSSDELLERVDPGNPVFIRSDYRYTLQVLRELDLVRQSCFLFYEQLFTQECLDSLCSWLGISHCQADFTRQRNPGVGDTLTGDQLSRLRMRLAPIYDDLRSDPIAGRAESWHW